MAERTSATTDEFVDAILTVSRALVGVSARSLTAVADSVTVVQFRSLVVLHTHRGINLNGLADALGVNSSTAMRMVDRLVAAGLATRSENPANRREVRLALTARGSHTVARVTAHRRAEIAKIVESMPKARRADLTEALQAFAAAAGEPAAMGGVAQLGW